MCLGSTISALSVLTCKPRFALVTEQTKGSYKYFVDLGDRMEAATIKTVYVDEVT